MAKQRVETTIYSLSDVPPRQPDRRSGERYFSLFRVGALLIEGRRELCLIRNVSAAGMMIRPYSAIPAETVLSVELKHGVTVSGVAQWSDNGLVGITFDEPIDVIALLTMSADGPQPRMPRIALDCPILVREDGDVYRSRGINISQGGICVEMARSVEVGAHVIVSTPGLQAAAGVVKWQDGDFYGIGFNRVFAVEELMGFLQSQQQSEKRRAAG